MSGGQKDSYNNSVEEYQKQQSIWAQQIKADVVAMDDLTLHQTLTELLNKLETIENEGSLTRLQFYRLGVVIKFFNQLLQGRV